MKKRILPLVVLIVLILAFSGCTGKRTRDQRPGEYNYRTGTEGIEISFPSNMPTKLFEGDKEIEFTIELKNKGAFPQFFGDEAEKTEANFFDGRIFLGGYDPNIIDIKSGTGTTGTAKIGISFDKNKQQLEGKSPYNDEGGYAAFDFSIDVKPLPAGASFYAPKIRAAVNYRYITIASPTICVDPEPTGTKIKDKPCTFTDSIGLSSQGGPVAVTKIDQDVTSQDILFKIYVENAGGGTVIKHYNDANGADITTNPFTTGFKWQELNKVGYADIKLGTRAITNCRPAGEIRLIEGKGVIFCSIDKNTNQITEAFETPLQIKLKYAYSKTAETSIEVSEAIK